MASKKKRLPISVAMVIHNEERLLARALDSCVDLVDDIVIVHDGKCTDNSLEIAKKYTSNIFIRPKAGAPEPHRPFSFAKAKNNWVLQLDADEYLRNDFRKKLAQMIKRDVAGYVVEWIEEVGEKKIFNMIKEVLFQKNRIYYIGVPCEYVKPIDPAESLLFEPVGLINNASQSNYHSWASFIKKYSKLATIQATYYTSPFSKVPVWNYSEKNWDFRTRIKINHPLLFGIIGMNTKYVIGMLKKILGMPTDASYSAMLHLMWYNTYLFWLVFQRRPRF